jgi:hypothetical protein
VSAIPFPRLYVQSFAADGDGELLIYCFTYPAEFVVKVDLRTGKPEVLGSLGNSRGQEQDY